ncbi:ubiquitin carboxyl-terminal hydrolase [Plectosphaerella plurivora]|uniref:Ubiquitin carboxyl-terminal hydrolase n=1 Tax=Plectosphaerella plurivora TaxID=936078 RepID=A0A9P9ABT8_9PEZI|nr:ubiquitin carboxyl-terminal hydrolase [Plectosphaerella plurivora]
MDQATASPEASDRPASSPEPVPTRPNPFDDENNSARKRRRTSPVDSPTPTSPPRSSPPAAAGPQDHPTTSSDTVMVHAEDADSPATASTMYVDPKTSLPSTPEGPQTADLVVDPPSSSRVTTINLRQHVGLDGVASSPDTSSPEASSPSDGRDRLVTSDLNMPDVDSDQRRDSAASGDDDTPTSSTLGASSPELVETVDRSRGASVAGTGTTGLSEDLEVLITGDQLSFDFAADFPFLTANESLPQVVGRIINFLENCDASDENVITSLNTWIAKCVVWFQRLSLDRAIACVQGHQSFWSKVVDLILTLNHKRHKYSTYGQSRTSVNVFLQRAGSLAAAFVTIDVKNLNRHKSDPDFVDAPAPYILSSNLLHVIVQVVRQSRQLVAADMAPLSEEPVGIVQAFVEAQGGGLGGLLKLIQSIDILVPRYPKMADATSPAVAAATTVLSETMAYLRTNLVSESEAKVRLAIGHQIFEVAADALSTSIDKYLTHLGPNKTESLVTCLGDLLTATLNGSHPNAVERVKQHRLAYPGIAEQHIALAICHEWRLSILCRLIKCSQMQLRVIAVRMANEELVKAWKTHNNDDLGNRAFMRHLAAYLDSTHIVEYILDPACHPEITGQSGNIVAFFVATLYYRNEHTDILWKSFAAAQDLRICDALQALVSPVLNLFHKEHFVYLFGKFQDLPIQDFSPAIRQLLDSALTTFMNRVPVDLEYQAENEGYRSLLPTLLIRLIRGASVVGEDGRIASPEVHEVAQARFADLVNRGLHPDVRRAVYTDCCSDIAAKTPTTLGSMWVLAICLRQPRSADVPSLMLDYDLPRSMIEELELATHTAAEAQSESVLAGPANSPRMMLLAAIIEHEPSPVPSDLCIRLLDALVGSKAVSQVDRDAGWNILNVAGLNTRKVSTFLTTCFADYLPRIIMPDHIRPGTLEFVKRILMKQVNFSKAPAMLTDMELVEEPDIENAALDDEKSFVGAGVQQLWRLLLATTNETLVEAMIQILNDIYIESHVIQEYPYERARQVHLHVVERCIDQMQSAAEALDADGGNGASPAADSEVLNNQRRIFTRSLAVLQAFLRAYRSTQRFSAPDLRSLMPEAPSQIQGDSADLKYQTFSGVSQSDIMPLAIGTKNTAASLLATLKEATGFDNYRVYYRGSPFTLSEQDISRSLEELKIHNALLLVKKEPTGADAPTKTKAGACGLEIKILEHFQPLWSYLSMEPSLARQVYYFLTNLPAESRQLELIDSPTSSHHDIFPKGEPYKCLYAVYTLDQYLNTAQKRIVLLSGGARDEDAITAAKNALARAWALVVDAVSDADLLSGSEDVLPKYQLSETLMQLHLRVLNDSVVLGQTTIPETRIPDVSCLMDLAQSALSTPQYDHSRGLAQKVFAALTQTSALSSDFWASFTNHPDTPTLIEGALFHHSEPLIRLSAAEAIQKRSCLGSANLSVPPRAFQEFFWPILSALITKATGLPSECKEFFTLVQAMLKSLCDEKRWDLLDPQNLASDSLFILLDYETTEDLGAPYVEDIVLSALTLIVWNILVFYGPENPGWEFPPRLAGRLFWQHLFPRDRTYRRDRVPRSVLTFSTRNRLCSILLIIAEKDESATTELVRALGRLTQFDGGEEEPYEYELPIGGLDRLFEVRAPCGYAGLRNLGNTCYLNSLLTQLFMNTSFRKFMVEAPVKDEDAQELLMETRRLFCNLQDTTRRYVDTNSMVSTIKTYDDTGIDVGVQMDVDEFYNLLFDRWEGQLSTPAERQTFRTFYGGQLVQQVSSKECEHISERFEPFSAIQCDIKGKKNLMESLQAYVDGEVMQGDNKYKCSDCDRHVDAVKRACLKDVPDNLIFHLKRFDFNLRTMMRSKINDYFAFPATIDMRPYTIEHLSGSTDKQEPDMFELVGVLVHAGTAESGHYYSYIRQRPTTGDHELWMEFNDDMVSPWDPKLMEDATFGSAAESRSYEHGGFSYEKSNNAYMLFYQRSSTLAAQRAAMQASGLAAPLRAETPLDIFDSIMADNLLWLRRWCLFDPNHFQFTGKLAERLLASPNKPCPLQHRTQNRMMEALIGLFDQAITRTKDLSYVEPTRQIAQCAVENCTACAAAFVNYMANTQYPLKALVQRNIDLSVRSQSVELFIAAVKRLREHDPDSYGILVRNRDTYDLDSTVAGKCAILFQVLWMGFHGNQRSWSEVFGLILQFAELGSYETALLLNEDWFWRVLMIVTADNVMSDLPEHFKRMLNVMSRRALNRPVNYAGPIHLIRHFMSALSPRIMAPRSYVDTEDRLAMALADPTKPLPWSKNEVDVLRAESPYQSGSIFLRHLLDVEQAPSSTDAIISVFARGDKMMRAALYVVLEQALDDRVEVMSMRPYLRATLTFVEAGPYQPQSLELLRCATEACRQSTTVHIFYMHFFVQLTQKLQGTVSLDQLIFWASEWAPPLLASANRSVADQVENHLVEELLPDAEEHADATPPNKVTKAVSELGLKCLNCFKREFSNRRVTAETTGNLQRVMELCEPFFGEEASEAPDVEIMSQGDFDRMRQEIFTMVQPNIVDAEELEEEGSGMSPYSDQSDDTLDYEC